MLISPCRDCPDRRPLCHGECARYKAFRERFDKEHVARVRKQQTVDLLDRNAVRALRLRHRGRAGGPGPRGGDRTSQGGPLSPDALLAASCLPCKGRCRA